MADHSVVPMASMWVHLRVGPWVENSVPLWDAM